MRVLLVALMLIPIAATVQAHSGHGGDHRLELDSLKLFWNPLTQSQEFQFHLWNNHTAKTGAVFARITLLDDTTMPVQVRANSTGLQPGEHGNFTASVPARVSVRGCIMVDGTGAGTTSNMACGQTSGFTVFPVEIPVPLPAVTHLDDEVSPENLPSPQPPEELPVTPPEIEPPTPEDILP